MGVVVAGRGAGAARARHAAETRRGAARRACAKLRSRAAVKYLPPPSRWSPKFLPQPTDLGSARCCTGSSSRPTATAASHAIEWG